MCARARPMLIPIYLPVLSYRPSHLATIHAKMALDRDYRQQNQFGRHSLTMVSFAFINIPYNRIFGRQPLHNTAQVRKFVLPTLCACMRAFVCSFTAILYCSFSWHRMNFIYLLIYLLHGPWVLPDKAKFTVCSIIKLATIAFDETSSYWSAPKKLLISRLFIGRHTVVWLPLVSIS